jgi:hypothetical protein
MAMAPSGAAIQLLLAARTGQVARLKQLLEQLKQEAQNDCNEPDATGAPAAAVKLDDQYGGVNPSLAGTAPASRIQRMLRGKGWVSH